MAEWKDEIRRQLTGSNLEPAREAEIVEEMSQHLQEAYEELVTAGVIPVEAERRILAELSERELLVRELEQVERRHMARPALRRANAHQGPRLYIDSSPDAYNWNRRNYGDLQRCQCYFVSLAALSRCRATRGGIRKLAGAQSAVYRGRPGHFRGLAGTK
jgi:hypothetical protein